ncbi:hypothetical protein EVAR_2469_1 [Eumeta japonica]|uniref:Uncharacterized protein n=1 Tax=Eumeta variegata TaxID=151549 RepID=A0A4C1SP50_EUMVA|nr:hypothetical protein EVAR_2469_1 [Eumeta japonica]
MWVVFKVGYLLFPTPLTAGAAGRPALSGVRGRFVRPPRRRLRFDHETFLAFRFRFCVGDRFYLCENKILCEYDYEERLVFANMAYNPPPLAHLKRQTTHLPPPPVTDDAFYDSRETGLLYIRTILKIL